VNGRFQFRLFSERLAAPLTTARGTLARREGILLRADNGRVAEAVWLPGFCRRTPAEMTAFLEKLGGRFDDETADKPPPEMGGLRFALRELARDETADAAALAGKKLPLAGLVKNGMTAEEFTARWEAGFRVLKLKIGAGDREEEWARVAAVLDSQPEGASLRLDANGGLSRADAEWWLQRLDRRGGVEFLEQPLMDADTLRRLSEDFATPLALDESLAGDDDLARWTDAGWRGVFVIKPSLHGGGLPRTGTAPVVFSSALETVAGARAALRLALEHGAPGRALGFGVWPLFARRVFDAPLDGCVADAAALGNFNAEAAWNAAA
jgi:O-succinylbenzoate synthase